VQTQRPAAGWREDPLARQAEALSSSGDHARAASLLLQLATRQPPRQAAELRLQAADSLLKSGQVERASQVLGGIDPALLGRNGLVLRRILGGRLALERGQAEEAVRLLGPAPATDFPAELQRGYYTTLADALRLSGKIFDSARALAELDRWTPNSQARRGTQLNLLQSLATLPTAELQAAEPVTSGVLGGWLKLALVLRQYSADPQRLQNQLEQWRRLYPGHPADTGLLSDYLDRLTGAYSHPGQIAVLLPRSGPFAQAGAALRDGILAAYYDQPTPARPRLRFYAAAEPQDIWPQLQQAVEEGAQLVIGPLQKDSVAQLVRAGELPVPVLALNRVELDSAPPPNLFQLGLPPEDEARAAAERAWLEGHRVAVTFVPDSRWGERLSTAFRARFDDLGARVAEQGTYAPTGNDFSAPVQALLNVDQSRARHQALQRLLGQNLEFEPHRRQDATVLFLGAQVRDARLIRPQIQFHQAADLPVIATSSVYSGNPNPGADLDLEGLSFPDMPWLLRDGGDDALTLRAMAKVLPESGQRLQRLYAMGIDAYRLIPQLARLQFSPRESLQGKTGILSLDRLNRVQRRMVWATFKNGLPVVNGYAPSVDFSAVETSPARNLGQSGL